MASVDQTAAAKPRVPKPTPCKYCGGLVYWAHTDAGKWMPVDSAVDNRPTGGDLVLTLKLGGDLLVERWTKAHGFSRNRYTSHFATCPSAEQARRSR